MLDLPEHVLNLSTDQLNRRKTDHQPMPDLAEFITTEETAKKLKLHIVTVRNMIRSKKLEGVKIGGKTWLVSKKSVENYRADTQDMSKNDPRRGRK